MTDASLNLETVCRELEALSHDLPNLTTAWPKAQFERLASAGVLGWVIPREYGGEELSTEELTRGYLQLTSACLTTTFILTQRNGACQRIAGSENEALKAKLLPALCRGEQFATVGISHLTTSRQHLGKPAVTAELTAGGWKLSGTIPWVTGAKAANVILTGGTTDDGRQVLIAMPTNLPGVEIPHPPELLALNPSQTGAVNLHDVIVPETNLVAGPVENVMKQGTGGGAGSLTTSALALGLSQAAIRHLTQEAEKRPDLTESADPLTAEYQSLESDLFAALAGETGPKSSAESIRRRANSLALRSSQAYLAATKGAGFLAKHPASRFVREAMFFLVWSCPQPVLTAQLQEFACILET